MSVTPTIPHRETWVPDSAEDRDLVRHALEEVLTSPSFRSSRRYPAMLRHIVEKTLEGHQDYLKERSIGVEVFGRDPDYDTNEDPVVRFSAGEIRKRLAQFYREIGSRTAIELHLPLGTYVPRFFRSVELVTLVQPMVPVELAHLAATAGEQPSQPGPSTTKYRTRYLWFSALIVSLLVGTQIAINKGIFQEKNPVINVWSPLINTTDPVLISAGRPKTPANELVEPPNMSIGQHFLRPEFRISITTVDAIAHITGFLQIQKKPFRIHDADTNILDDLHNRPVVLVNAYDNKWTLLLLKSLRFRFELDGDIPYVQDAKRPDSRNWNVDFSQPFHKQTTDYAIVARFNSVTTGAPVIVIAGISSNGTEAAGEFIVAPERLSELLHLAPPGWKNGNFEAVLKVEVIDGNTGASSIVGSEFW